MITYRDGTFNVSRNGNHKYFLDWTEMRALVAGRGEVEITALPIGMLVAAHVTLTPALSREAFEAAYAAAYEQAQLANMFPHGTP